MGRAPNSSDNYIVALTQYNSAGRAYRAIDNLGRITETRFDDTERTVRTIRNYDDGTVAETDVDQDVIVDYQYDSGARLVTMTAYNAKGSGGGVQEQATKYLYASTINASWQTGAVYPDSDDVLTQGSNGVWTFTTNNGDHVSTGYDRLGRTTSTTDQRGVVHDYTFDSAGRLSADTATSLGSSGIVDGTVRHIGKSYDDIGRVQAITSYSDTSGTTVVNQIEYEYNGWGRVYREYQEHDGAVDANSLFVQYNDEDGASGGVAKYVRLDEVVYPDGNRTVDYDYGTTGAVDDIMSRLASIGDGTDTHASYRYLGVGRIVEEDYEDVEVNLDYSADDFAALDRFGRVLDQVWTDYGADPDVVLDHYSYNYDRAGNRTSRDNELHSAFDEDYTYDGLNRLTDNDRADAFDQSWGLDGLGNFSSFDDDGTSQSRTANAVNEITGITGGWITPSCDDAGNLACAVLSIAGVPSIPIPAFFAGECMYYRRLIVFFTVVVLVLLFGASVALLRERWLADACEASAISISLSLQGYRDSHGGRLPPPFIEDKGTGQRHSWRAMLLPYRISNPSVWEQYSFQESWNSSGNRQFGNHGDFACTAHSKSPKMTNYVAVVGKNTLWPPPEDPQMWPATVGMRVEPKWPNTIVLVELVDSHIPWTEPRDITLDGFINTIKADPKGPFYNKYVQGIRAIDASGQLRVIDPYGDVDTIRRMFVVTEEAPSPSTGAQEESDAPLPTTEETENNPDADQPKP